MLAACQQARYIEEGPPVLDLYEAMSADDVAMAEAAMQTTLETAADNASVDWRNPETGNGGRFTPIRTYQTQGGYFCRTFDEELTVDGRTVTYADNHACRSEQGVWLFQDD